MVQVYSLMKVYNSKKIHGIFFHGTGSVSCTLEGTHVELPKDQPLSARGNVSSLTQALLLLSTLTKLQRPHLS